jgi:predicted cation transporter
MRTEIFATICFGLALLHTFSVKRFQHLALQYPNGSVGENFFHLLGEIEVVFGIWALIFLGFIGFTDGTKAAIDYLENQNFMEPMFVFVIMAVCSTRPILEIANWFIGLVSKMIPLKGQIPFYFACLTVGPLLGSFITEPAAMTVTALILLERFYKNAISEKLKYATLGLLFVNVSIGGTLTPYAAPPVLMVAGKWNWDLMFMFTNFGWKAMIAVICSTSIISFKFRKELSQIKSSNVTKASLKIPIWVSLVHLVFLSGIILTSHHPVAFVGIFLFFLGLTAVTKEYQDEVKLREGLLVGFFLGGLVILGGPQRWWLEPILSQLNVMPLYLGGMALTAITDNAALTYLGSQVPSLSEAARYALVAGSVVGGGLTVIANAPNPAGYGILNSSIGKEGISPLQLFVSAIPPTAVAAICFWFL